MRRIIKRAGILILSAASALLLCRVAIPVSPTGFWTGPAISCLCDAHNFIHFKEDTGTAYYEDSSPPQRYPLVRVDRNTWRLDCHKLCLTSNKMDFTIDTNQVLLCQPGWFWMRCNQHPDGSTFVLHRDLKRKKITEIMKEHPTSLTLEEKGRQMIERMKRTEFNKVSDATSEPAPGADSSSHQD